jgi:diguanylate cyclase (GGDEF)-like protein
MRFRSLERRSLQDPATGAYIHEYFEDVTRNELEKANRFGRCFSVLRLDAGDLEPVRLEYGEGRLDAWMASLAAQVRGMLRATDVLAIDPARRLWVLLPEVDALGAARLRERVRSALQASELVSAVDPARAKPEVAVASFPADGAQLEALVRTLEGRLEEARASRGRIVELERMSVGQGLRSLLERGEPARAETASQIARFVLDEVGRRPDERRLLFVRPGRVLAGAVAEGLAALKGVPVRAEIAVVAEGERPASADADVAWVAPGRVPGAPPFLLHYGEGAPYVLVRGDGDDRRMFHTRDRSLVEHLALRLRRELAVRHPVDGALGRAFA